MNNRLEKYLSEMESRLRALPPEDREREITEVTQHLDALIAAGERNGATEAEATESAIAQFGAARDVGNRLYQTGKRKRFAPLVEVGLFYFVFSSLLVIADQGTICALNAAAYNLALRGVISEATAQNVLQNIHPHTFVVGPYGAALQLALFLASVTILIARYGCRGVTEKVRQSAPVSAVLRFVLISYAIGYLSPRVWYHISAVITHRPAHTMPLGIAVAGNITLFAFACCVAYLVGKTNRGRESVADAVGCAAFVEATTVFLQTILQFMPVGSGGLPFVSFAQNVPGFLLFLFGSAAFGVLSVCIAYFGVQLGEKSRRSVSSEKQTA